jgi:hypothetical protein
MMTIGRSLCVLLNCEDGSVCEFYVCCYYTITPQRLFYDSCKSVMNKTSRLSAIVFFFFTPYSWPGDH